MTWDPERKTSRIRTVLGIVRAYSLRAAPSPDACIHWTIALFSADAVARGEPRLFRYVVMVDAELLMGFTGSEPKRLARPWGAMRKVSPDGVVSCGGSR